MKKKTRTPEEQLAAAQVPEASWPYALPEGWTWVRLGGIAEIVGGGTPSSKIPEYYTNGTVSWIRPADLSGYQEKYISRGERNITEEGLRKSSARLMPAQTVLLSTRAPIGYVAIASEELCTNQGFKNFLPSEFYVPSYLYWFLKGNKAMLERNASGTTFLELSAKKAGQIPMPLPPLETQKSIVRRIESLFQKLDEAEEKIEAARASFETRRAALLHQAFAGELTAEWRKNHGNIPWEDCTVKSVCDDIKVGIVIKPTQYYTAPENGTPAFRSANVREFRVDFSEWVYINEIGKKENARTIVHEGDVLVVRSGNPGTACVVPKKCDGYGAIDILIAVPNTKKIMSEFLCAYTNSPYAKDFVAKNKRGIALPHFNVKGYGSTPIKLPPLDEQQEIVRRLDHLLACEGRAAEAVEVAEAQLRKLRASILARAFRGRL